MLNNDGIVISDSTPTDAGRFLWLKHVGGKRQWHEKTDGGWILVHEDEIFQSSDITDAIAAHAAISTAHHAIPSGITGSKTIGGYKLTFTAGLLTGFEAV